MQRQEPDIHTDEDLEASSTRAYRLTRDRGGLSLQRLKQYIPIVKTVINRLGGYLPPDIPESTLIGRGLLALMEAAENYSADEPDFDRLAERYIWRAVAGTLRQSQCFTEQAHGALARLEEAYRTLETRGQGANDEALAEVLAVSVEEINEYLAKVSALFAALPAQILEVERPGGRGPLPHSLADWQQQLGRAVARLPQAEQLVVALYYFEDLTFPEIAEILEIDVARVQQLFGRAAVLLRSHLARDLAQAA